MAYARWEQRPGSATAGPVAWRSAAALVHLQLGEADEARELAAAERPARARGSVPRPGSAVACGRSASSRAVRAASRCSRRRSSVLEASGARLEHARALVDLGALLRRCGQRTAATEPLRAGMDLAHRCGADGARRGRRGRAAARRRPAAADRDERRGSLTPSEHRVTDLAAQGMSNKQIAQALFVTLRTVEMHLSNAYGKLEIAGRRDLAAALAFRILKPAPVVSRRRRAGDASAAGCLRARVRAHLEHRAIGVVGQALEGLEALLDDALVGWRSAAVAHVSPIS